MSVDATTTRALELGMPGGEPATLDALVRHLEPDPSAFAVVVLGAGAAEPVRLAQHAQSYDRDLAVLIVTGPDDHARLAGAVSFAPFLTGVVRCVPAEPPAALAAAIDDAAAQTVRRRGFHATLGRAREQLGASTTAPPADTTFLQHVLEHVPIAILAVDPRGHIVASNVAAHELLGRSERELFDRDLGEGLCPSEREELAAAIAAALAGTGARAPVSMAMVRDGRTLQLEGSVSALPRRQHPRAVVMLRDVSEQRALLAQLRTADRLATVGMLAAGVAHEVNNPLTAVLVNVDRAVKALEVPSVSDEPLTRALRGPLRDALEASDRIQSIVRDLMLLARSDDDGLGPVDVEPVIQSTVRMASSQIRDRAQLVARYGRVPFVRGNGARLGQVVLNLILNAIHAIGERGDANGELRITTSADDTHVHIDVEDNGPGMAAEVLERLFTPFFTTKPPGQGTGLGLSISHRIVTGMGGTIGVDSGVGRGTRVRVSLVRAVAETPALARTPSSPAGLASERRRRILLVDDDVVVLRTARKVLAVQHEVEATTDPMQALELATTGAFDVIVCDLMMAPITGMELYATLRERAPAVAARMVFVTGGAYTPDARAFFEHASGRILTKPFRPAQLLALVDAIEPA